MKEVLDHLDRIAKANNDSFESHIDISHNKKKFELSFITKEIYDGHVFLCVTIDNNDINNFTISEFVIKEACESWNYKYVE